MDTIRETPHESIDIRLIQPELEGVSIKASAVSPAFAARVLSPRRSPPKVSPDCGAPSRTLPSLDRRASPPRLSPEERQQMMLAIACQPENRRLTMHAGHTPSHSRSFPILDPTESGNATPTQQHPEFASEEEHPPRAAFLAPPAPGEPAPSHPVDHLSPLAEEEDEAARVVVVDEEQHEEEDDDDNDQGDKELAGPLGLTGNSDLNHNFLQLLNRKLEGVIEERKSRNASPSESSWTSEERSLSPRKTRRSKSEDEDEEDGKDEGPVLRLKPSMNFGRPMGSM
jgi:hypothetical protein